MTDTDGIPLLPHKPITANLALRNNPRAMLKDALRDRVYVWSTPELLAAVPLPLQWVEVWHDRFGARVLLAREPIAPLLRAWCWLWSDGKWCVHRLLIKLGLLMRDASLSGMEASHYKNFRWQWRFWRGPYYEAAISMGLVPPRWRDSWRRWS